MKRTWIFFALLFLAFAFSTTTKANPNLSSKITQAQPQVNLPDDVCQILCECSKLVPFTYEELVDKYWQKEVSIEKIDVDTIRVTIIQEDGNPVIADIMENF